MKKYKNGFTLRNALLAIVTLGIVATTVPITVQKYVEKGNNCVLNKSANKLLNNLYSKYTNANAAYAAPACYEVAGSGFCCPSGNTVICQEPVIFDLDGDGVIEVSDFAGGIYFDYRGNGYAMRTTWAKKGDGVLAVDWNENGKIDSEKELIHAEDFPKYDKNEDELWNKKDEIFSKLRIMYRDGSLKTMKEEGIVEICARPKNVEEWTDENGNFKFGEGWYKKKNGKKQRYDEYYFQILPYDTEEMEVVEVSSEVKRLPNIKSYGTVMSLHQSMMRDAELKELVEEFVKEQNDGRREELSGKILEKWTGAEATVESSDIDPKHIAVVEKIFNASDTGLKEVQNADNRYARINKQSAEALESIYLSLKQMVYGELMSQTHLSDLTRLIKNRQDGSSDLSAVVKKLEKEIAQNPEKGKARVLEFAKMTKGIGLDKTSNYLDAKDSESFYLKFTTGDRELKWQIDTAGKIVFKMTQDSLKKNADKSKNEVIGTYGADAYKSERYPEAAEYMMHMMDGDDVIYGREDLGEAMVGCNGDDIIDAGGEAYNILAGNDGSDILFGGSGRDKIQGGDDDDIIFGGAGADEIYPDSDDETEKPLGAKAYGNDIIVGGPGTDIIYSYVGNDTFVFNLGDGNDTIYEEEGNDTLYFGKGITWRSLTFEKIGNDMLIRIKNTTDTIVVKGWYSEGQSGDKNRIIENFEFANGEKYSYQDIKLKK